MSTTKPIYLNDHWTLADGLGFGDTAEQLARVALQAQPPFTVALTGKWGAGKTSVLRQAFATLGGEPIAQAMPIGEPLSDDNVNKQKEIWEKLKYFGVQQDNESKSKNQSDASEVNESSSSKQSDSVDLEKLELSELAKRCLCVWYSPWQHQQADNPLLPLLLEIKKQYSAWAKFTGKLHEVNKRGGWAGLALIERVIDATATIANDGKQIKLASGTSAEVAKAWRDAAPNLEQISDGQRFHLLFEEAIETLLQSRIENLESDAKDLGDARLVIFIDDLDRCEESVIVQLLESIKLYLHSQRCVFVLGIDPDAVLGALKRHWKERSEQSNAEYLEKLVQAQLEVPQPSTKLVRGLIETQLSDHGIPIEAPPQPPATEETSEEKDKAKDADSAIDDLSIMLEKLLEPNPRKVKNFLNSLSGQWHLLPQGKRPKHAHLFALFHYLRLYHRPVWRLLSHQNWTLRLLLQVLSESKSPVELRYSGLNIRPREQSIAGDMLARAFSHVLADESGGVSATPDKSQHRNMPLEQAVQLFTERLDRKRSDQYFINYFRKLVRSEDAKSIEAAEQLLQQMNQAQDGTPA